MSIRGSIPQPFLRARPPFPPCRLFASAPPPPAHPRAGRRLCSAALAASALGVGLYLDHEYNARTISRNARTLWNGAMIALDYKFNFDPDSLESINALHERAAKRLLYVCEKNGGLYVKAGQAIGIQAAILPKPYHALSQLFDNAEPLPYPVVERAVRDELGRPIKEVFVEFDEKPVGSASIAQVHKAVLKDGQEVAVKVQRPDIRKHAKWDLLAFRTLMHLYERIFDLPLSFAAQYISDQIEKETLFLLEAANATRIGDHVRSDKTLRDSVHVPRIVADLTTQRLLVMEWVGGAIRMTDRDKLEGAGLDVKACVKTVCEVFAAQIFKYGFVQCDPHPSNVLIRKHPTRRGKHQVVLIDHGLYVSLEPEFRRQYCQLWRSLFVGDLSTVQAICSSWGIGDAGLFASATLLRPFHFDGGAGSQAQGKRSNKTDLEVQRELKERVKGFLKNYEMFPKELIFIGRSMRIIQANNQALGSPVNRIHILAVSAADNQLTFPSPTRTSAMRALFDYLRFRLALLTIDALFWWTTMVGWVRSGGEGGGFEDELETQVRRMAQREFGVDIGESAFMG